MGGQNSGDKSYTTHVVVLLGLTLLMYVFAYWLVDHNLTVPDRVDSVHSEKSG